MGVAEFFNGLVGGDAPVEFRAYDGTRAGPEGAPATVVIRSPRALRRLVTAPNELGLGRAYVAGDIDLDGDIFSILSLQDQLEGLRVSPDAGARGVEDPGGQVTEAARAPAGGGAACGACRHSRARDAAAIAHHYDVSNDFYLTVLGPSMTYSCAVWTEATSTLEEAQANKYELVCNKLGLEPRMRLLDIGCGWGGMILHAAQHHGVRAVGVTLSRRQAELAAKRVAEAGLTDRVEVRCLDYRDIDDGPYDAISSIGMFEHVGWTQLGEYFSRLRGAARAGWAVPEPRHQRAAVRVLEPGCAVRPRSCGRDSVAA